MLRVTSTSLRWRLFFTMNFVYYDETIISSDAQLWIRTLESLRTHMLMISSQAIRWPLDAIITFSKFDNVSLGRHKTWAIAHTILSADVIYEYRLIRMWPSTLLGHPPRYFLCLLTKMKCTFCPFLALNPRGNAFFSHHRPNVEGWRRAILFWGVREKYE